MSNLTGIMIERDISSEQKELQIAIGKRVRTIRKEKKIVQSQIAADCGFDATNITRLEAGRINPTIHTLNKIAKSLDVSLSELFKGL